MEDVVIFLIPKLFSLIIIILVLWFIFSMVVKMNPWLKKIIDSIFENETDEIENKVDDKIQQLNKLEVISKKANAAKELKLSTEKMDSEIKEFLND